MPIGKPSLVSLASLNLEMKEGMKVVTKFREIEIVTIARVGNKKCYFTETDTGWLFDELFAIVIEYEGKQILLQESDWQTVLDNGMKEVEFEIYDYSDENRIHQQEAILIKRDQFELWNEVYLIIDKHTGTGEGLKKYLMEHYELKKQ